MTIPTSVDAARLTRIRFAALGSAALVLLGAVAVAPAHPGVAHAHQPRAARPPALIPSRTVAVDGRTSGTPDCGRRRDGDTCIGTGSTGPALLDAQLRRLRRRPPREAPGGSARGPPDL
ncbi:hypothetical protein [Amnibacterium sp.]|uniref:hypothetical protein n=1 Tax=Amnibacterium sp. TaxID=1872496 RepID=UPI00262DBA50|nr:hypothetical protein [Amnibacterium sp.]MCU1471941.1 hypothetical protein [Amnibacterium sp.]